MGTRRTFMADVQIVLQDSGRRRSLSPITSTPIVILTIVEAGGDITVHIQRSRHEGTDTMTEQKTVQDVTYDLLRSLGLTTMFGNPGSTEETFLKNFPDDFTYVLGLQEASVLAMADGFAQSTGAPALVNLHTAAGSGNAMGILIAAYKSNTPLIVTAGQQTREMVLCEPYLTNSNEALLPLPWAKWVYQPARAEDVPAAFMRAYTIATQPPAGPVYLSIPLDDWEKPALGPAVVRAGGP